MASTETEVKKKAQAAQAAKAPVAPLPTPPAAEVPEAEGHGFLAGVGEFFGTGMRRSGEAQIQNSRAQLAAAEATSKSIGNAGRRVSEGFSAGAEGRDIDPSKFVAPLPPPPTPAKGFSPEGLPLAPGTEQFEATEQNALAERAGIPFDPNSPQYQNAVPPQHIKDAATPAEFSIPNPVAPTLADSATSNLLPRKAQTNVKADADNNFLDGVPDGFVEIIRGAGRNARSYVAQDEKTGRVGRNEFKSFPGLSLEESQQRSFETDPTRLFLEGVERENRKIGVDERNAASNELNVRNQNKVTGTDANGNPIFSIPDASGIGFGTVAGITPILEGKADIGRFSISKSEGAPGQGETVRMVDSTNGTSQNITQEETDEFLDSEYRNMADAAGGVENLSIDEIQDIVEEIEEENGPQPELLERITNDRKARIAERQAAAAAAADPEAQ